MTRYVMLYDGPAHGQFVNAAPAGMILKYHEVPVHITPYSFDEHKCNLETGMRRATYVLGYINPGHIPIYVFEKIT